MQGHQRCARTRRRPRLRDDRAGPTPDRHLDGEVRLLGLASTGRLSAEVKSAFKKAIPLVKGCLIPYVPVPMATPPFSVAAYTVFPTAYTP